MNHYLFTDLHKGMEEGFEVNITQEMQDMFCKLTGDVNPLHTDSTFASKKGYSDCVVYGMLTASLYSTLVGVYLPGEHCLFHEINSTFERPVFVGDFLKIGGVIEDIRESTRRVKMKAQIINQRGEIVNRAKLTVGFTRDVEADA